MLFIDAGAFIPRFMRRDPYRSQAISAWQTLAEQGREVMTTDAVVVEVLDYLSRYLPGDVTAAGAVAMMNIPFLRVVEVEGDDFERAIGVMNRYRDQQFSFTDCLSFAVMKRLGIRRAFTFDHHFAVAGVEMWPE